MLSAARQKPALCPSVFSMLAAFSELLPRFFEAYAARGHRLPAGFRRAHGVGAGEEGPGDEEGPAGVLERALASKLL